MAGLFSPQNPPEVIMITQQEFVEGCLLYYRENYYEQGNPEDGVWQECHYPVPKCLGGTNTVLLLEQHHAIQGVLQSEEFQHPCLWTWEKTFLEGEFLSLYYKWMKIRANANLNSRSKEERREAKRKQDETLGPQRRRAIALKGAATMTAEQKKKRALSSWEGLSPEERTARAKRHVNAQTPEQRREKALKGWETRRKKKEVR